MVLSHVALIVASLQGHFVSVFALPSVKVDNQCSSEVTILGNDGGSFGTLQPYEMSGELLRIGVPGIHVIQVSKGPNVNASSFTQFQYILQDNIFSYNLSFVRCNIIDSCVEVIKVEANDKQCPDACAPVDLCSKGFEGQCSGKLGPGFYQTITLC